MNPQTTHFARPSATPTFFRKQAQAQCVCHEAGLPHFVLGKGSDLLVSDDGFDGAIAPFSAMVSVRLEPEVRFLGWD